MPCLAGCLLSPIPCTVHDDGMAECYFALHILIMVRVVVPLFVLFYARRCVIYSSPNWLHFTSMYTLVIFVTHVTLKLLAYVTLLGEVPKSPVNG
ncbi:hypothetical protein F5J12DRAFT_884347 [Pisolithus orientalis]|uniref:uncharacterized protein n=1 Tax=Pisolithus orientalis TaxID=936130 RepID=UPI002224357E|nr:uncharacterized protein F5J12DRAFT_884347 [Pisolithus orientalis]KAI5980539.1 hypothetical protein F5J12DRAFT_884347 [Pisolithus orientalis]